MKDCSSAHSSFDGPRTLSSRRERKEAKKRHRERLNEWSGNSSSGPATGLRMVSSTGRSHVETGCGSLHASHKIEDSTFDYGTLSKHSKKKSGKGSVSAISKLFKGGSKGG